MKLGSLVLRMGVVSVLTATLGLAAGSPASAAAQCADFFGSAAAGTNFTYCAGSHLAYQSPTSRLAESEVSLLVGRNATISATGCSLSVWAELHRPGAGYWETPHTLFGCRSPLEERDRFFRHSIKRSTIATAMKTHFCVYLMYDNSSTAGWSQCRTGDWNTSGSWSNRSRARQYLRAPVRLASVS